MPEVRISMSDAALAKLQGTMADIGELTGKSGRRLVMDASYRLAVAIRARSKKGKKRRRVLDNPEWKQAKGSLRWARARQKKGLPISAEAAAALDQIQAEITPYYIEQYWQGGIDKVPSYDKKDPRATIEDWRPGMRGGRGLARGLANIVLARIATARRNPPIGELVTESKDVSARTFTTRSGNENTFALRHINRLSYLTKAYPMIETRSLQAANNKMTHDLKELRAKMLSRWEKAA